MNTKVDMPEDKQEFLSFLDLKNRGEMKDADAIGIGGSGDCGDILRLWIKFKEEKGKKVIDKATFQSFGCQTAMAIASMATEMIKGKKVEEALSLSHEELSSSLGPLPPMKIHCAQLVEEALRSALLPKGELTRESKEEKRVCHEESTLSDQLRPPTSGRFRIQLIE